MTKVISLYSHKGGVSKTTTSFHLGWKLADLGLNVLLVDLDPQCNLTSYVVGAADNEQKLVEIYKSKEYETIYDKLEPIVSGNGDITAATKLIPTKHAKIKLLAGSLKLADFDVFISFALSSNQTLPFTSPLVGALNHCIRATARTGDFDVVILDLSPSASAFNRSALMSSDYFIVPTSPEFFSLESLKSMGGMLAAWSDDFLKFRKSQKYPLPEKSPKFLGIISQRFSLTTSRMEDGDSSTSTDRMAKRFRMWLGEIQNESKNLAQSLMNKDADMSVSCKQFQEAVDEGEEPYNLISISDFCSLAPLSQKYSKPVFALEDRELESKGAVQVVDKKRRADFDELFNKLALRVATLCGLDSALKVADKEKFDIAIKRAAKPAQ